MRIKNSINNISSGILLNLSTNLLSFLSRTIFIYVLGQRYLGINGIMSNILSMLSLAELGIGTAINFSLYKPLACNDEEKIISLMQFYKKAYSVIGLIIFFLGVIIMPFIKVIITDINIVENLYLIYFLFLIDVSSSYFITYKTTLITADQKLYKLTKINLIFNINKAIIQIIILSLFKNYYCYLIMNIIITFIQRLIINKKIDKLYPLLKIKTKIPIVKSEIKIIKKNVKAMLFHKIGDYCINSTDNIIISIFISTTIVGYYSNYFMIISMINGIIILIFNSITSSFGNLIASESNNEKKEEIFSILNFTGYLLFSVCALVMFFLFNTFIELWIGKEYTLDISIVFVLMLNFYLTGMRVPVSVVKMAAGIYDEDKFTPIIQSAINLIVSIFLVQKIGLIGVFIGTLISSLLLPCWQRPYLVYKYVFRMNSKKYFLKYLEYFILIIGEFSFLSFILSKIYIQNLFLLFTMKGFIIISILIIINYLVFKNSYEFKYLKSFVNFNRSKL